MTSIEIYNDIKFNECKKVYHYLKLKYVNLIKSRFTINKCIHEAEDRFASSFSKLYSKIIADEITNTSNLAGYFLTICRNSFLIDAQRNKVKFFDVIPEFQPEHSQNINPVSEVIELSQELIDLLPFQLQVISKKIYLEGKDHKEIAKELNINYQNVRKYQYKAIKLLQSKTPQHYKEYIGNAA